MDDRRVLYVGMPANGDLIDITPDYRVEPDAAVIPQADLSDYGAVFGQVAVPADQGFISSYFQYQCHAPKIRKTAQSERFFPDLSTEYYQKQNL
jgi:hypothetical protein